MNLRTLVISGAVISSFGTVLLISFVSVLLIFPVTKNCIEGEKCDYFSQAPEPLGQIIQQSFLAVSLLTIAAGVMMIRVGRWLESKQAKARLDGV